MEILIQTVVNLRYDSVIRMTIDEVHAAGVDFGFLCVCVCMIGLCIYM